MISIDWLRGSGTRRVEGKKLRRIIIAADWAPIRKFSALMAEKPEECYGDVMSVLRSADLRIVNLECTLGGSCPMLKGGPNLSGKAVHLEALKQGGFEVVSMANNHVFDYGREGFAETLELLHNAGIRHFGAGENNSAAAAPLVYELDGLRIGLAGFTEGHDLSSAGDATPGVAGWKPEHIYEQVLELRRKCHVVIVIPHGGIEFCAYPPRYCIDCYRMLAEAEPDVIVAHHPHVPQGIEVYNGTPIFYSLGNFLFYQETMLASRKRGFLVELTVSECGLERFDIHPYAITDDGVHLLADEEKNCFMSLLHQLSRPFDGDPYEGFYGVLCERWNSGYAKDEFRKAVSFFDSDSKKAAALFRNRMTTLQHTGLYIPMFDRVIRGIIDEAPDWAVRMEHEFMNRQGNTDSAK